MKITIPRHIVDDYVLRSVVRGTANVLCVDPKLITAAWTSPLHEEIVVTMHDEFGVTLPDSDDDA